MRTTHLALLSIASMTVSASVVYAWTPVGGVGSGAMGSAFAEAEALARPDWPRAEGPGAAAEATAIAALVTSTAIAAATAGAPSLSGEPPPAVEQAPLTTSVPQSPPQVVARARWLPAQAADGIGIAKVAPKAPSTANMHAPDISQRAAGTRSEPRQMVRPPVPMPDATAPPPQRPAPASISFAAPASQSTSVARPASSVQ